VPTDAERFHFLEAHKLSVTFTNDGASIYWRGKDEPGKPGGFYPIASGPTLQVAVDRAISRWERKHRASFRPAVVDHSVVWLEVRGWAS
jgi:hypothetical protein